MKYNVSLNFFKYTLVFLDTKIGIKFKNFSTLLEKGLPFTLYANSKQRVREQWSYRISRNSINIEIKLFYKRPIETKTIRMINTYYSRRTSGCIPAQLSTYPKVLRQHTRNRYLFFGMLAIIKRIFN